MATPHTAGIVALMLDANPKLTFKQIRNALTKTATDYGTNGFDNSWGYGEVNALLAVREAEKLK
jgi:serine protease AprX